MMLITVNLSLLVVAVVVQAQEVNVLPEPGQVFDIIEQVVLHNHSVSSTTSQAKYYTCLMRGLWDPHNQEPSKFPPLAHFTNPLLYSHAGQTFLPWLDNHVVTTGVEKLAESGFTDRLHQEIEYAAGDVLQVVEGEGFFVDTVALHNNLAFLPPLRVDAEYPYLTALVSMQPSPDWFTGFYLLDYLQRNGNADNVKYYYDRIKVHTYPWDAGTDGGVSYTALPADLDPPFKASRIVAGTSAVSALFMNPATGQVLPVAEWECHLRVCNIGDAACNSNIHWPPANKCDAFRYPGCDQQCPASNNGGCQECTPQDAGRVFFPNCCQSNYELLGASCAVNFTFANLTMPLVGVAAAPTTQGQQKNLTLAQHAAFAKATQDFYLSSFWAVGVFGVGTEINVTASQMVGSNALLITYDQTVSFDSRTYDGMVDQSTARQLIDSSLANGEQAQEYATKFLQKNDPVFAGAYIGKGKIASSGGSSSGGKKGKGAKIVLPILLILGLGVGGAVFYHRRMQGPKSSDDEENGNDKPGDVEEGRRSRSGAPKEARQDSSRSNSEKKLERRPSAKKDAAGSKSKTVRSSSIKKNKETQLDTDKKSKCTKSIGSHTERDTKKAAGKSTKKEPTSSFRKKEKQSTEEKSKDKGGHENERSSSQKKERRPSEKSLGRSSPRSKKKDKQSTTKKSSERPSSRKKVRQPSEKSLDRSSSSSKKKDMLPTTDVERKSSERSSSRRKERHPSDKSMDRSNSSRKTKDRGKDLDEKEHRKADKKRSETKVAEKNKSSRAK